MLPFVVIDGSRMELPMLPCILRYPLEQINFAATAGVVHVIVEGASAPRRLEALEDMRPVKDKKYPKLLLGQVGNSLSHCIIP